MQLKSVRYYFYTKWFLLLKKCKVGPKSGPVHYGYPNLKVVLDYLRAKVPLDVKGEIKEDAYVVSMHEFCNLDKDIPN